jgi:hypothetical protein
MLKRALPFLPILIFIAFSACTAMPQDGISSGAVTSVIQSLTATMWTPTPSPTPEPNLAIIMNTLNGVIIDSDPLGETVAAKFNVLDVHFPAEPSSGQRLTMQIDVECEWILTDSCTPEESFVRLMHGFDANDKVIKKVAAEVPATVKSLEVSTFNHRVKDGTITVNWGDVLDFATGKITGNELGARIIGIVRFGH